MEAQDKTRVAYRDQFRRGDRSLLDLLDSQNEFFDSQRAHISATVDLIAAEASTLSNMGMLLASLDVRKCMIMPIRYFVSAMAWFPLFPTCWLDSGWTR